MPGDRTVHSPDTTRDVGVSPMPDYLVVAYRRRATAMSRELDGKVEPRVTRPRRCLAVHRRRQLALDMAETSRWYTSEMTRVFSQRGGVTPGRYRAG
jgi:hypothetical protein